jgi:4-hydroxyphenylpyruvate dioxygenase
MPLTIATSAVPGDLPRKLEAIAKAGFAGIDLARADFIGFDGNAANLTGLVEGHGLKISMMQSFEELEGLSDDARAPAFDRLERTFDLMGDLGTEMLMVRASTHPLAQSHPDKLTEDLGELARRADARGLRVAYQALPWARTLTRETDAAELIAAIDSPALGLGLNSLFSLADGSRPARLGSVRGDQVFHVQLSDAPRLDMGLRYLAHHYQMLPGQGDLNLGGFVRVLARAGYNGPWSIDTATDVTTRNGPAAVASDAFRALVNLLDEVEGPEPGMNFDIPALPKRVRATGFEFIEFAADERSADDMRTTLRSMRFRRERQHRTKSVELWRQGAVNIVINTERSGYAHSAFLAHGPTVCDMGLRVEDATLTAKRATGLGGSLFSQPVGAGELDIPAVRGVGGSVVHFIDEKSDLHRVWDIEFLPVPRTEATQPAGLRRIDHLAQTMRHEDMQSWLLFYLSTFDMRKSPVVDVHDPAGHVHSQAIQTPEGEIRLNLNGTEPGQTVAGAFIADKFGAGVQHIALLSDDIFETSALLAASGFQRLAIPSNYYAHIQSTYDLDEAVVARIKAGNILYSRTDGGEFFQIYSLPILGGFFFEIVERRNGYTGFGARNAPIRIAAQSRLLRPAGMPLR